MVWVIVGHTYLLIDPKNGFYKLGNPSIMADLILQTSMRLIINAQVSVDSFFMIGGCLLSYLSLKEVTKLKGGSIKFWIMFYVHRYIRLTGALAGVILISSSLIKYMPYAYEASFYATEQCTNDWWTNLLYINNFKDGQCLGQTWYLAVEMQLFIITPFLLLLMFKYPMVGNIFIGTINRFF